MDLDLVPTRPGDRPPTIDGVRVCAAEECTTVLSRYNTDTHCFFHRDGSQEGSPV